MMSSASYTESWTSTFTEARARAVMRKVLADLVVLSYSGILATDKLLKWDEELTFLLIQAAMVKFQVQLRLPSGGRIGVEYIVSDDGTLSEDSDSGGIDYVALPSGTTANLTVRLRDGCPTLAKVRSYLEGRGWTFDGSLIEGATSRDRAYSKEGFGLIRAKVGDWP
jgi:hypothetical protein